MSHAEITAARIALDLRSRWAADDLARGCGTIKMYRDEVNEIALDRAALNAQEANLRVRA